MALAMSLSETGRYDSNHIPQGESLLDSPEGKIVAVFAPVLSHVPVSAPPFAIGNDVVSVRETNRIAESLTIGGVTKLGCSAKGYREKTAFDAVFVVSVPSETLVWRVVVN